MGRDRQELQKYMSRLKQSERKLDGGSWLLTDSSCSSARGRSKYRGLYLNGSVLPFEPSAVSSCSIAAAQCWRSASAAAWKPRCCSVNNRDVSDSLWCASARREWADLGCCELFAP